MYSRRSLRLRKGSKEEFQGSPSPNEEYIYHKWTKKQNKALRKTEVDDSEANTDDEKDRDILEIIDSAHQRRVKKDEGWSAGVPDEGVDSSDEDCDSVISSISSGPTVLHSNTAKKQRSLQGLCSACWNLYQKAKQMKGAIQNKLLDNGAWTHVCLGENCTE